MKFTAENRSEYIKDKYSLRNLKKNALTDVDQVVKVFYEFLKNNTLFTFLKIVFFLFSNNEGYNQHD